MKRTEQSENGKGFFMHIPLKKTAEIQIPLFEEALRQALLPQTEYDSEKWLYVPPKYEEYRFILGTRGKNPLICIGINPSTAIPGALDNTLKSVERIAAFNGFDGFIMFNLYAQRATDPDHMEKEFNRYMHEQNMEAFRYVLAHSGAPSVWAAWGAIIEKRAYLYDCVADMADIGRQYGAKWYTCGKRSVKGHPHHPLYLKKDSVIMEFDPEDYIEKIRAGER